MLGGMLNPMSIANDARQAAMTFYDSIAPMNTTLVNIAKVAGKNLKNSWTHLQQPFMIQRQQ